MISFFCYNRQHDQFRWKVIPAEAAIALLASKGAIELLKSFMEMNDASVRNMA